MPKNIKIFLSSVQHVSTVVPANFEPYYVLESYWYLKSNGKQTKQLMNWFLKAKMFLLDSGAFTFMNCKNKKTDFDAYVDGYIKFINDWDVKYFFEMDLDALMPYSEVLKLRERIESGTGKRCIPVWHKSRGREEWTKMCQEYDIVAIGGIASKEIKPAEYGMVYEMCEEAKKYNCIVHGLGFLRLKLINEDKCPFDMVDGSGWQGHMRGKTYKIEDGKLNSYDKKGVYWKDLCVECYDAWDRYCKIKDKVVCENQL